MALGDHFAVTATDPATPSVYVAPGAVNIVSTYPGHTGRESYVAVNDASGEKVNIPPTAGSPRRDLLVVEIEDTKYATPSDGLDDVAAYQYARFRLVQGVSKDQVDARLRNPHYVIAAIDQPANNQTITSNMIRQLQKPARSLRLTDLTVTKPTYDIDFPEMNTRYKSVTHVGVYVPNWACSCIVEINLSGVKIGLYRGVLKAGTRAFLTDRFGDGHIPAEHMGENSIIVQEAIQGPMSWNQRQTHFVADRFDVRKFRNKNCMVGMAGLMSSGGKVTLDYQTIGTIKWTFIG